LCDCCASSWRSTASKPWVLALPLLVWWLDRLECSLPGLVKISGEMKRESQVEV
jgi:hypothetical protein